MDLRNIKGKEARRNFVKKIYDFCEDNNWDRELTEEYGKNIGTSGQEIRRIGRVYVKKYMGLSDEEIFKKLKQINKKVKESLSNYYLVTLPKTNVILEELGITTNKLWTNEKEKKIVLEYIYKYCDSVHYSAEKLTELGQKFGINNYAKILKLANIYANTYLGLSQEEFDQYRRQASYNALYEKMISRHPNTAIKKLYTSLLAEDDVEKQIEILRESGLSVAELNAKAFDWAIVHGKVEDCELLRKKISNYSQRLKEENEINRQLQIEKEKESKMGDANTLISKFISCGYETINSFCDKEGTDKKEFNEYLQIVSEKNPKLYDKYNKKIEELKFNKYTFLVSSAKSMVEKMQNGVTLEDGRTRPFDVVDYFQSTKMTYEKLLSTTKSKLSADEIKSFRIFISKNRITRYWLNSDIESCYEAKHMVGVETDEKGQITSPGHELTKEEKESIIRTIRELNVPLCSNTYYCMVKRYNNGFLSFETENNKVLKKNSN